MIRNEAGSMSSDDDREFGNDDVQIIARDEAYRGYMPSIPIACAIAATPAVGPAR
jgi:hypothetical protein